MNTNHAHVEAALLTLLAIMALYGITALFGVSLPATLFGLPLLPLVAITVYLPLYLFRRSRWRE